MHGTRMSTIGYLVFQISTCGHSLAASLDFSRSTASSYPTLLKRSSPMEPLHISHNVERSVSSVINSYLKPASPVRRDAKPRHSKHAKKHKEVHSCPSREKKNYRVRAKVGGIVGKVEDVLIRASEKTQEPTSGDSKPQDAPSGDAKSGDATYYATGLGACGTVSTDESMIAAASHLLFDTFPGATANPNLNPICGRKVKATYEGKSVEVQIVDRCTGCALNDLDFSPSAFSQLGKMETGRLHGMKWEWI